MECALNQSKCRRHCREAYRWSLPLSIVAAFRLRHYTIVDGGARGVRFKVAHSWYN